MAYTFNGTDQYLSAAYPGVSGGAARTIAFWFRTTANNVRQFVFACGGDTSYARLALEFGDSGSPFSLNVYSTAYNGTTVPVINTWYHIAITYDGSVLKLFVNGTQEISQTVSLTTSTTNFNIGRFYGASLYFGGQLAEFAKWEVALSAGEITALAAGFSPAVVRNDSLEFHAPLIRELHELREAATITNNNSAGIADHPRIIY